MMRSLMGSGAAAALSDVPEKQRRDLLSGMRWSVWLSFSAVPLGAAINLLLARIGPATIGVYGLLSVYIGLISAFFYFGGDTVVVKFTPECAAPDRAAFLLSYLLLILLAMVPWLALGYLEPSWVAAALGDGAGERSNFILLCLAPIPITFHVVVAYLRGLLDITIAQVLVKSLVLASLTSYGVVWCCAPELFVTRPQAVIWGIYLGFTLILALAGAARLRAFHGAQRLRFYLPQGFWRYALDTQMVSAIGFLTGRLDYVLLLNFGGLANLGRYVAILSVATAAPLLASFFVETLMPALSSLIAVRNCDGAAQVFLMHMRILLLVSVAGSCAIMMAARLAVYVMGAQYRSLQQLIIAAALLRGIAAPGPAGGILLASVGRQRLALGAGGLQAVLFAGLFLALWPRWELAGGVLANGVATIAYAVALIALARRAAGFYPSIARLWLAAAAVEIATGAIALWGPPLGIAGACIAWLGAMTVFFRIAGYELAEVRRLARIFMPGARLAAVPSAERIAVSAPVADYD